MKRADDEKEVRTPEMKMLSCTYKKLDNGSVQLIFRNGKKEDRMLIGDFLYQIYGHKVMVVIRD